VFSTNETGGIIPPLANETGGIIPPLANETGGIIPPPTEGGAEPLTAEIAADLIEGDAPLTVELSAVVAGGTEPYTYSWDFGDGSAVSDQPTVQHIFENPFIYTVTLTVSDATGQVVTPILEITVYEPLPPAEEPPAEEPPAEEPPAEEPPAE
jgi:PKD repeat protein